MWKSFIIKTGLMTEHYDGTVRCGYCKRKCKNCSHFQSNNFDPIKKICLYCKGRCWICIGPVRMYYNNKVITDIYK